MGFGHFSLLHTARILSEDLPIIVEIIVVYLASAGLARVRPNHDQHHANRVQLAPHLKEHRDSVR